MGRLRVPIVLLGGAVAFRFLGAALLFLTLPPTSFFGTCFTVAALWLGKPSSDEEGSAR